MPWKLKAENVSKSFSIKKGEQNRVISGISLEIEEGEMTAIVGPSGVGKSTLLYMMGSLDAPDSGKILLKSRGRENDYSRMRQKEIALLRNQSIGFVYQFHHLLPEFTALENVVIPSLIGGASYGEAQSRAMELLERVGVAGQANQKPSELSGGEQQRVAIARALVNEPDIVFADEPTGNLDAKNADSVLQLMLELKQEKKLTFVLATHSREVADAAERVLRMASGNIFLDS